MVYLYIKLNSEQGKFISLEVDKDDMIYDIK